MNRVNAELILVNSASTDNTLQVMQDSKRRAKFSVNIASLKEKGLGRARNAGMSLAAGRILVFTDDDCYLTNNYLDVALHVFDNQQFRYCGGTISRWDESDSDYGCYIKKTPELIPPYNFIPAGKIQGASMVIHRDVFDSIGGFDPMLGAGTPFRCEDVDFIARASMAGFCGAYIPELIVYHHHGRKPGKQIRELIKLNDFARGAFYLKMILSGYTIYSQGFIGSLKMDFPVFMREFRGAIRYFFSHLFA